MLSLLLLIVAMFTLVNIKISQRDIISPAAIACLSLFVGVLFSCMGVDSWEFRLSATTFFVVLAGMSAMTMANLFSGKRIKVPVSWIKRSDVVYSDKLVEVATFCSVIFTILYGLNAYRVGMMAGGSGINAFAYMKTAYMEDVGQFRMNPLIRQLFKPVIAIAYVNMFLFIDTVVKKEKNRRRKLCGLASILSAVAIVIFSGSRTEIMQLLSGGILMFSVLWREHKGWNVKDNKKSFIEMIRKVWPVVFSFLALAFISRNIVKTTNNELSATSTFLQYIIYYVGSSVAVLNKKIKMVYSGEGLLFGNDIAKTIMHAQVYLGKLNYGGNTATIFISVFEGGLLYLICRLLVVFFIGILLYRSLLLKSESSYKRNRNLVLMSMSYYVFTMAYYSDCVGLLTKTSNILTMFVVIFYHRLIAGVPIRKVN